MDKSTEAIEPEGQEISSDYTVVRQSIIKELLLCPMRVRLSTSEGYVEPFGESLAFGTVVHKFIELNLLHDEKPSLVVADLALREEYDEPLTEYSDYKQFYDEAHQAFNLWLIQVKPFIERLNDKGLLVEQTLHFVLDEDEKLVYQGTPDVVVVGDSIHDFKTALSMRKWTQDNIDVEYQPTIYLAVYNRLSGENLTSFYHHVYDRKKKEWNTFFTERSTELQDIAVRQARDYARMIKYDALPSKPIDNNYSKNQRGWYCSPQWCGGWNICEDKLLNDDLEEGVEKRKEW